MKKKILAFILVCAAVFSATAFAFTEDEEKIKQVFDEDFSSEAWAENWDNVPTQWYDGAAFQQGNPYTWHEDGKVFLYMWGQTIYPKGITGHKLTAELTLETENAINSSVYVWFANVADSNDNTQISITKDAAFLVSDGISTTQIAGVKLTEDDAEAETYIFELEYDKLTITEKSTGSKGVLSGDAFKKHFTTGAEYKAGIYTVYYTQSSKPIYIDNFKVSAVKFEELKPTLAADEIDTRPGAEVKISFPYALSSEPTQDNIYLENSAGEKAETLLTKLSDANYELALSENVWLLEGESFKVCFKDLEDIFGQKLASAEIGITSKTYTTDFSIGEISRVTSDGNVPIDAIECGTYEISAKLLPNKKEAQKADLAIMVCEGTADEYRVSDIYYYNGVLAFGEKTAEITIGDGEFLKLMSISDFESGRLASDSVIITQ